MNVSETNNFLNINLPTNFFSITEFEPPNICYLFICSPVHYMFDVNTKL